MQVPCSYQSTAQDNQYHKEIGSMFKQIKFFPPVLSALLLGACSGEPEWVEVYEQCKETVQSESDKLAAATEEQQDAQSRTMAESMNKMAINMAMTACEMIRSSCEQDANSPSCRAYVEQGSQH
jgi:hypothetical protein